jgi:hypothetical protein
MGGGQSVDLKDFLGSGIAGLLYVAVGIRMGRLYLRSRQLPELCLGICFVLWGCSYMLYAAPSALADDGLIAPLFSMGNVLSSMGTLACAVFIWRVFRDEEGWAARLTGFIAFCLVVGIGVSAWRGELEGASPLVSPWYWLDWLGATTTYAWLATEAFLQATRATQRMALGLCDSMVRNRLRLWSIVASGWLMLQFVYVFQDITWAATREWPGRSDTFVGLIEIASISIVWLIFFAPSAYRRWISGSDVHGETQQGIANAD